MQRAAFREKSTCRGCGKDDLTETLSLGNMAVSDFVQDSEQSSLTYAPLALAVCDPVSGGCGLVQLAHQSVPRDALYRHYWYRSGTNESMRAALADVVRSAEQIVRLAPTDVVVDIGSNDGTLLNSYAPHVATRVGFEPANNVTPQEAESAPTIIHDYFSEEAYAKAGLSAGAAQIITAVAMFYDLDDPHSFLNDVASLLANTGLFVIQMAYLPTMLRNNCFDNICHEHVAYYSLHTLETMLREHDLVVRDVHLNDVNGGSFRVYIQRRSSLISHQWPVRGAEARLSKLRQTETDMALASRSTHLAFGQRVEAVKYSLRHFIEQQKVSGKVIHGYGASTKGNTILQYFGLTTDTIRAIAERDPKKWGLRTAGTDIPIVSERASRRDQPDFYLALPWHFRHSFIKREGAFLKRGGGMIFPLPDPVVVSYGADGLRVRRLCESPGQHTLPAPTPMGI